MALLTLQGVRVVDLTGTLAGAYCTKMLADAGADVVTVEPTGSEWARWPETPGLFDFLHTSKRSVNRGREESVVHSADIVVAGETFMVTDALRLVPRQVVVTISAFGMSGPWANRPATEFTLQAECGSTGGRGLPGEAPLAAGGRLGEWLAGTYAAIGAVSAWWRAEHAGVGAHVDVAVFDCMAVGMVAFPSVWADFAATCQRLPIRAATPKIEVPSIEPTTDGWVNFTTNSAQQFSDFAVLIGRPELSEDQRYVRASDRFERREEFWQMTRVYTAPRTSATVLEEAALLRIPVAPVLDGSTVHEFEQFVARKVLVEHPSGRFRQPRIPYRLHGRAQRPFGPVPKRGEHNDMIDWPPRRPRHGAAAVELPLVGVRVVDMTSWWAGPAATHVLACLGADVIKVESILRPDPMRLSSTKSPGDPQWWEWGPVLHAANTNKRAITLDLTSSEGRSVAIRLLATADLAFENFTPRVIEQFDLDWDRLHEINPRLSLVRMPAFGLDGPWRDRPGFAQTMESLTGMAALTGWPGGSPVLVGGACDPIAGLHATFAALVALLARADSGQGYLVESTMVEAALNVAAMSTIGYQLTGAVQGRLGNRSWAGSVPRGVYPCAGANQWLAVEVENDHQWALLCGVIGWPLGSTLPTMSMRLAQQDALEQWMADVTRSWEVMELVELLTKAGVPAAVVITPSQLGDNVQLSHRGLFEDEEHPVTGRHRVPGLPFTMSGLGHWVRRPSPLLGQHNDEILGELGIHEAERTALRQQGIIGEVLAGGTATVM
jgi:crotonobetainyl-CoA:carnitine CoA-transferase CaiB-like acyl-CoA transferase